MVVPSLTVTVSPDLKRLAAPALVAMVEPVVSVNEPATLTDEAVVASALLAIVCACVTRDLIEAMAFEAALMVELTVVMPSSRPLSVEACELSAAAVKKDAGLSVGALTFLPVASRSCSCAICALMP